MAGYGTWASAVVRAHVGDGRVVIPVTFGARRWDVLSPVTAPSSTASSWRTDGVNSHAFAEQYASL